MPGYRFVTLESSEGIAVLTLSQPARLNAYSLAMVEEIHAVLDALDRDLSSRVLILTGAGRAFCAGIDLKDDLDSWPERQLGKVQSRYRMQKRLASMVVRLREIPQPVIAAVHGPAVGGGLALAAACDVRLADPTARFGAAFIKLGLSAGDDGATWLMPRIVNPSLAAELLYTGRLIDASEALRIGLVSRVTEPGGHVTAARDLAREMLANSPFGIRMTKELLNYTLDAPGLRHVIELENRTQALCMMTEDFEEGTRAFAERRPARYRDR
jgi:enoyl-CoA hydratase